jgi:hydroxyquinol 1,2-dioxygenase
MHTINEHNITDAVVESLQACADPRLKEILVALVRHLHGFVRETRLTEAEWRQGIEFLTATGHMTDDKRQEFILLSDTLGVSMLTVAQNHAQPPGTTEATVFGPFHLEHAPEFAQGADIANGAPGEPLFVDATVRGPEGEPVPGASADVWQADEDGYYDVQIPGLDGARARGVLRTDAKGRLRFRTILPVAYPVPTDGPVGRMLIASGRHPWRPAHVHFRIAAPGYKTLITHVFRAGDPYLDSDVVFGVRASLVADYVAHAAGCGPHARDIAGPYRTLRHDFVLARSESPPAEPPATAAACRSIAA